MDLFAPTYAPKMVESHPPKQSGLTQPEMAPALKLPQVKAIHFNERVHLRTPIAQPLKTPVLSPLPPPAALVKKDRRPRIDPLQRVAPRESLWR